MTKIDKEIFGYTDYVDSANKWCQTLRDSCKCDIVIALTHLSKANDIRLAQEVPGIDLILGGHDHIIYFQKVNQSLIIKSGTDFFNYTINEIELLANSADELQDDKKKNIYYIKNRIKVSINLVNITKEVPKDELIVQHVNTYIKKAGQISQKTIGFTAVDIDTRDNIVRKEETNGSMFVADVIRYESRSDVCILNGGAIRSNCIIPKGKLIYQNFF